MIILINKHLTNYPFRQILTAIFALKLLFEKQAYILDKIIQFFHVPGFDCFAQFNLHAKSGKFGSNYSLILHLSHLSEFLA